MVQQPLAPEDESRIIERAIERDVDAFSELYGTFSGRVFATCLRLSGDRSRAEDLTQEVFLKLWTKLGTYKATAPFSSWLHRLTTNTVIDRIRSERRRNEFESTDEQLERYPDRRSRTSPDTGWTLEKAIASLPTGARVAFVLHDIEGYKHEEIGQMTGIAAGTSKAQLHRARKLLRELLR